MRYAFYNMGPVGEKVDDARARLELNKITSTQPFVDVTGLVECIGRDMPGIPGQVKIRSTQNPSKANLCLYVEDFGNFIGTTKWIMCEKTWPRVEREGTHEPRAILVQNLNADQTVILSHAPQAAPLSPRATRNALLDARQEWLTKMANAVKNVNEKRSVLILCDPNGLQDMLREAINGRVVGTNIDAALSKRFDNLEGDFRASVGDVTLLSDHHGYLKGRAYNS